MNDDLRMKYDMRWQRPDRTYQCVSSIPCRLVAKIGERVRIAALLKNGKEREHVVRQKNLRHDPCMCFAECRALERIGFPRRHYGER
jgi:hypothetical protein